MGRSNGSDPLDLPLQACYMDNNPDISSVCGLRKKGVGSLNFTSVFPEILPILRPFIFPPERFVRG